MLLAAYGICRIELDDETLQCLAEAVGSEDSLLRHAALTIAAKALSSEAVSHLLSIETIENTMTNMREKVAEIRRAANIVMRLEHSDPAITLFQRYYIGQSHIGSNKTILSVHRSAAQGELHTDMAARHRKPQRSCRKAHGASTQRVWPCHTDSIAARC